MPFAAVKGLEEALAKQEQKLKTSERPELGEEKSEAINAALCSLRKGETIQITYFHAHREHTLQGIVEGLNTGLKTVRVSAVTIPFSDILDLQVTG